MKSILNKFSSTEIIVIATILFFIINYITDGSIGIILIGLLLVVILMSDKPPREPLI